MSPPAVGAAMKDGLVKVAASAIEGAREEDSVAGAAKKAGMAALSETLKTAARSAESGGSRLGIPLKVAKSASDGAQESGVSGGIKAGVKELSMHAFDVAAGAFGLG
ncbi:hypothetical protein HK405_007839, partial [Cladochytrium tenue]